MTDLRKGASGVLSTFLDVLTGRAHLFGSDPVVELFLRADVLTENVSPEVVRELTDVVRSVL